MSKEIPQKPERKETPQEIEVKFVVPSDAVFEEIESLKEIEGFKILDKKTVNIENSYLDTKDKLLKKNDALLRIREGDDSIDLVFKRKISQQDNFFIREEIHAEIPQNDLGRIQDLDIEPVKRAKEIIDNNNLQKSRYKNKVKRTILNLGKTKQEPIEIEMVLDGVTFLKGEQKSMPFYEIEIESKGISVEELKKFGAILEAKYNLEPSTIDKKERGEQIFEIKPEKYNLEKGIERIREKIKELKEKITDRPIIINIAGGSSSGKTEKVAKEINESFPDSQTLSLDDYYKGKKFMESIGSDNWDEPEAVDLDLNKTHIQELKKNKPIQKPIYSMKKGERTGYEKFSPSRIVIVEGLFALNKKLINETDLPIFVEIGIHGRLLRRLMRDIKRTGQTPEEILKMYIETVHPMHELHIEPSKEKASLIIVNEYDPSKEADRSEKYEIQIKLPINNLGKIRKKLEDLKIEKSETKWQQDTYFEAPGWKLPKTDELMRIRQEGEKYILAYKGPSRGKEIRTKPKIEFQIDPDLKDVLEKIGYKKALQINKQREKYLFEKIEIVLDKVENLGEFMELRTENPKDERKIDDLIKKLGLDSKQATKKSYFELMLKKRGVV